MVRVRGTDGSVATLPGVAPVAMQQGRYAATVVRARLEAEQARPFHYHDKGNLATIGRGSAVADIKGLQPQRLPRLGSPGWSSTSGIWSGSRTALSSSPAGRFSFVTHGRGARLITGSGADVHSDEGRAGPP